MPRCFVTGHGFSRAATITEKGVLTPEAGVVIPTHFTTLPMRELSPSFPAVHPDGPSRDRNS